MPHDKYADLQFLHRQLRTKNSDNLKQPVTHNVTQRADHIFSKSSAQVESWVLPQAVIPNSGELKLRNVTHKKGKDKAAIKRPSPLSVRLSEDQKETVRAKAREASMPVNAFVKYALLGTDYDPNMRNLLHKTYCELTKQGVNLNQIAKQLNSGTATPDQGLTLLEALRVPWSRALRAVGNAITGGGPMP